MYSLGKRLVGVLPRRWGQLAQDMKSLHQSQARPAALPPMFFLFAKPLSRVATVILGKGARIWWNKLPADSKIRFRQAVLRQKRKLACASGLTIAGLWSAYESHVVECPVTGRRRFVALTPDQAKKIGRAEFTNLLDEYREDILPRNHKEYERVSRVANRILAGNRDLRQIYDKQWTVTVVDQPTKNAFVLPSGNIFVFRGMLDLCENDDQLGVILGHEMAHAVLGHVAEKLTLASFIQVVMMLPFALMWAVLPNDGIALVANWFIDKVIHVVVELPFSRDMELEADQVGLLMTAKACFDVREAPAFWGLMELMSEDPIETDKDLEFASTHPSHSTRQESLTAQLSEALTIRNKFGCAKLDCSRDPNFKLDQFKKYLQVTNKSVVQGQPHTVPESPVAGEVSPRLAINKDL